MDDEPVLGPSGQSTLLAVNVRPETATKSEDGLMVDLLTQDGTTANLVLPTTEDSVEEALAPVGSLVGAIAGQPAGDAVVNVTNGLSPTVATLTSTVDGVAQPVVDGLNGVLAPVVGEGGVLAPVTDVVGGLTGNLPIGSSETARSFDGPLLGVAAGNTQLTGPSTEDTLAGVNLLSESNTEQGQLVTANVLTKDTVLEASLPTTAEGVEAGLAPVGNLVGAALGEQAGGAVDQVSSTLAPVLAPVTATVDGVLGSNGVGKALAPVSGIVDQTLGGVGGGETGSVLAPVTGVVGQVLGGVGGGGSDAGSVLSPVTGAVGQVLGGVGGGTGTGDSVLAPVTGIVDGALGGSAQGGVLAPVTGTVNKVLGGLTGSGDASPAGSVLAPAQNLLGGLLGGRGK